MKCGNGSNVGAYRILALGTDKLAPEGENVTLTFKATPWSEVTSGAGYTMDNKLVDIYVNDDVVATDVRISFRRRSGCYDRYEMEDDFDRHSRVETLRSDHDQEQNE